MNTWTDLQAAWQGNQADVDVEALTKVAVQGRRRLLWRFAGEVIASLAVVVFWLPFLAKGGVGVTVLGGGSILFVVVWCALLWRNQRGTWAAPATTVDGFRALQRRRASAELRWTNVHRRSLVVMSILFVVASPFVLHEGGAIYRQEPWRFVVGTLGFFAIVAAMWVHTGRQRRRHAAALAALGTDDTTDDDR